jgi:hypothetical protein
VTPRTMQEKPTLDEFSAVLAAIERFGQKMYPRKRRSVTDGPRLLAELRDAIERVEAVWTKG